MAGPNAPAQPPQLSRRRPAPTGDEEATTVLKLGDMADTPALSVAECKVLLDQLAQRGQQGGGRGVSSSKCSIFLFWALSFAWWVRV